jgi:diguanylate cyclase (GGDEF)-like protein
VHRYEIEASPPDPILRAMYDAMADGLVVVDAAGTVLFANASAIALLGRDRDAFVGKPFGLPIGDRRTLVVGASASVSHEADRALQPGDRVLEMRVAPMVWLGGVARLLNVRDVTEAVERYRTARTAAVYDPLTGLANRTLMTEHLAQALRVARRDRTLVALLFIDLDDFKEVNDRWGHAVGDALLRSVAGRLSAVLRDGDGVARLGGDEFTVTLTGVRDPSDVDPVARKALDALAAPHDLDGRTVRISASVGSALFPTDATHGTELVMLADTAMYRAKVEGKNRFLAFAG